MTRSLITVLGRGPYTPTGERGSYRETRYAFSSPEGETWQSEASTFFLEALLGHFARQEKKLERVVVLGTRGSMWDNLLARLCADQNNNLDEDDQLALMQAVDEQDVTAEGLVWVAEAIERVIGLDVKLEVIPAGLDQGEQVQILGALQKHVAAGDEIYLDVTHGFRHLPMLALSAASLLGEVKGARVADILYAMGDAAPRGQPVPVVSLAWLLDIQRWTGAVGDFRASGRLHGIAAAMPPAARPLKSNIERMAFFLDTNQIERASEAATRAHEALPKAQAGPAFELVRAEVGEVIAEVIALDAGHESLVEHAERMLAGGDILRAVLCLAEVCKELFQGSKPPNEVNQLRTLRNALAHASQPDWRQVRETLGNEQKTQKMVRKILKWVREQVGAKR